jgi:hypothetical protein
MRMYALAWRCKSSSAALRNRRVHSASPALFCSSRAPREPDAARPGVVLGSRDRPRPYDRNPRPGQRGQFRRRRPPFRRLLLLPDRPRRRPERASERRERQQAAALREDLLERVQAAPVGLDHRLDPQRDIRDAARVLLDEVLRDEPQIAHRHQRRLFRESRR